MPTFAYTARLESGESFAGTVTAASIAEAQKAIRAEGKYPISIKPAAAGGANDGSTGPARVSVRGIKISRADVISVSQQLAIMIETGVTLIEALDCIAEQTPKGNMKTLLKDLSTHIQGGGDFSSALARHPRSFPQIYVALIRSSEKSGQMSKMLNRALAYMRDEQEIVRKVRGALTYPGIMFSFAILTTVFLLAFVMPRFTTIYASKGAALPLPTKILMSISDALVNNWPTILVCLAVGGGAGWYYLRTPAGRKMFHWAQLNTPLVGQMFRKLHLARGMRMIGTMAGGGVGLVDCVATANELCPNSYFRMLWSDVSTKIQSGKPLSEPLLNSPLVPRTIAQMIHSAERSGKLAYVMEQVAGYSEQELKEKINELTRYIEPAMIVLMGVLIGGVALALMLPIFTISKVVAN